MKNDGSESIEEFVARLKRELSESELDESERAAIADIYRMYDELTRRSGGQ